MTVAASDDNGSNQVIAHTLRAEGADASEDGTGRGVPLVVFDKYNQTDTGDVACTLGAGSAKHNNAHLPHVAYQCHGNNVGPMGTLRQGNGNVTGGVPFIVNAAESCATESHARQSDVARCLDQTGGFAASQGGTVVVEPQAFNIIGLGQEGKNHAYPTEVSGCLQHKGLSVSGNEAGTVIAFAQNQRSEVRDLGDSSAAIPAEPGMNQQTFIAQPIAFHSTQDPISGDVAPAPSAGNKQGCVTAAIAFQERTREGGPNVETQADVAYSLNAPAGDRRRQEMNVAHNMMVRRLTPLEACRLQAFPDD